MPQTPSAPASPPRRPGSRPAPQHLPGRLVLFPRWTGVSRLVRGPDGEPLAGPGQPLPPGLAEDLALVLRARRVPVRVERQGPGLEVKVPGRFAAWAGQELSAYLAENPASGLGPDPGDRPAPRPGSGGRVAVLWPYFGLLAFYLLLQKPLPALGLYPHLWVRHGAARADLIWSGEWWRAATALTLHADPAHALSNAVVGGAFALVLAPRLGAGLALALTVAAGFAGNLLNAALMGPEHGSIGFSTAVFGAAGLLGASSLTGDAHRFPGPRLTAALVPVAAGLGLLALLGVGDETSEFGKNIDLGAHLCGFAAGLALGLPAGSLVRQSGPLAPGPDALVLVLAWLFPAACWWLALAR